VTKKWGPDRTREKRVSGHEKSLTNACSVMAGCARLKNGWNPTPESPDRIPRVRLRALWGFGHNPWLITRILGQTRNSVLFGPKNPQNFWVGGMPHGYIRGMLVCLRYFKNQTLPYEYRWLDTVLGYRRSIPLTPAWPYRDRTRTSKSGCGRACAYPDSAGRVVAWVAAAVQWLV